MGYAHPLLQWLFAPSLHTQHQIVHEFLRFECPFLNQHLFQLLFSRGCNHAVGHLLKASQTCSMGFKSEENAWPFHSSDIFTFQWLLNIRHALSSIKMKSNPIAPRKKTNG
ncbi:hypothetical protein TNCV_2549491 [Trichonephila clavipes]|nr:hypothetical protein TNCV_2549491 [Trichonephila clavipes]